MSSSKIVPLQNIVINSRINKILISKVNTLQTNSKACLSWKVWTSLRFNLWNSGSNKDEMTSSKWRLVSISKKKQRVPKNYVEIFKDSIPYQKSVFWFLPSRYSKRLTLFWTVFMNNLNNKQTQRNLFLWFMNFCTVPFQSFKTITCDTFSRFTFSSTLSPFTHVTSFTWRTLRAIWFICRDQKRILWHFLLPMYFMQWILTNMMIKSSPPNWNTIQ